ncbi:MAG: winged helix DNA-binding domain-containing protein [Candidatus Dormibacteria bacterium]
MTASHEIGLLRLVAQRIAGPRSATVTDTVRWLTAMQAQDYNGVLTSVALRTASGTRQGVEAALNAGEVVKSWPMRGTLHLVVAEDLPWMLRLAAPRVVAAAALRRAQLDLDPPTLEHAENLAVQALSGGRQLSRAQLFAVWAEGGLVPAGQRGVHLLGHLALTGIVCFGPARSGEQVVVLVDDWIAHPRRLGREEALAELAGRYFRSHGPATVKDFTRWTNLAAADARTGLDLARSGLARVGVDGIEHFMDPETPALLDACRSVARGVFLLPGFDEFMLGYLDRSAVLAAEFANRIVPGGNGMFRPTVLSDGHIVGTWKHSGRGAKRTVTPMPFRSFPRQVAAAIPRVYATLP